MTTTYKHEGLDPISNFLITAIESTLDANGAWEWDYRIVGLVSALIFLFIKLTLGETHKIAWYGWIHSIVTALGAVVVVYLDYYAAEPLTGLPEPLRTAQCEPPLTSLHRILPAITLGFSLLDFYEGLFIGIDFAFHGLLTMAVILCFYMIEKPHAIAPFLIMECSSVFINIVRSDLFGDMGSLIVQMLFALTFTLSRIVICPPLYASMTVAFFQQGGDDCNSPVFKWSFLVFGVLFNGLNGFWFYKLVRKVRRKVLGIEKPKEGIEFEDTMKSD